MERDSHVMSCDGTDKRVGGAIYIGVEGEKCPEITIPTEYYVAVWNQDSTNITYIQILHNIIKKNDLLLPRTI